MDRVDRAIDRLAEAIATRSRRLGREVVIDRARVADRGDAIALQPPGEISANGACRLLPAADGWVAINLPRAEDLWLVPALTGCSLDAEPWAAVTDFVATRPCVAVLDQARLLGLAAARVGETSPGPAPVRLRALGPTAAPSRVSGLKVADLSSLWAGPLCGAILAQLGAQVVKIESRGRPDSVREATPALFQRLNGAKAQSRLDFADPAGRAALGEAVLEADVVITSARPRAFAGLGLAPDALVAARPGLIWVAITAHGWSGSGGERIGFGDDAAAAGGLVRWGEDRRPGFVRDAIADPLTGLAAAAAVLEALERGGGVLIDAAMAGVAAHAAAPAPARTMAG